MAVGIEPEKLAPVDKAGEVVTATFIGKAAGAVLKEVDRVFGAGVGPLRGMPRARGKLPAGMLNRICSIYIGMLSSHMTKIIKFILF